MPTEWTYCYYEKIKNKNKLQFNFFYKKKKKKKSGLKKEHHCNYRYFFFYLNSMNSSFFLPYNLPSIVFFFYIVFKFFFFSILLICDGPELDPEREKKKNNLISFFLSHVGGHFADCPIIYEKKKNTFLMTEQELIIVLQNFKFFISKKLIFLSS